MARAGYLFKQTQPDGQVVAVFNPDIDMNMPALVRCFRDFAVACGFNQILVDEFLPEQEG